MPGSPASGRPEEIPKDVEAMSFEAALEALEEIVRQLESGQVQLEQSIEIFTRGNQLKRHCEAKLKTAQAKIEQIRLSEAGEPVGVEPLDSE